MKVIEFFFIRMVKKLYKNNIIYCFFFFLK